MGAENGLLISILEKLVSLGQLVSLDRSDNTWAIDVKMDESVL